MCSYLFCFGNFIIPIIVHQLHHSHYCYHFSSCSNSVHSCSEFSTHVSYCLVVHHFSSFRHSSICPIILCASSFFMRLHHIHHVSLLSIMSQHFFAFDTYVCSSHFIMFHILFIIQYGCCRIMFHRLSSYSSYSACFNCFHHTH